MKLRKSGRGFIVDFQCDQCGKWAAQNKFNYDNSKHHHFCSRKCLSDYGRVDFNCPQCGKQVTQFKSQYELNNAHFCSRKCANDFHRVGWINPEGYRRMSVNGKCCAEHRIIMEKILGRTLFKGETVHHINGQRADNRPENLELRMDGNHPQGWSVRQICEYVKTVPKELGGLK